MKCHSHINGTYYHHDLSLSILTLITSRKHFVKFLYNKVSPLPHLPIPGTLERNHCEQPSKEWGVLLFQCALNLNAHYVLGTVTDAENTAINETEKILFLHGTFI